MAPRRIAVADTLGIQKLSDSRPNLGEKLLEPDRIGRRLITSVIPDYGITMAMFKTGRMMSEDYPKLGDYIARLMGIFEYSTCCGVYLLPRVAKGSVGKLEHRVSVMRERNEFVVYGSNERDCIIGKHRIRTMRDHAFATRKPTFVDQSGIMLIFDDLDMNNRGCTIFDTERARKGSTPGSIAFMPFYYRDPSYPSGMVVFEGDLRCKDSDLTGLDAAYWSAHVAIEAASQIAFIITHKFDAITTLTKFVDFNAELIGAIRRVILGEMNNVWVFLIDLDNLKRLNDFSYQKGNEQLRRLAETAKASIRPEDMVARWGGDEFAGVIKGVSKKEALEIADRIRGKFTDGNVTCSVGVASVDEIVSTEISQILGAKGTRCLSHQKVEQMVETIFANANTAVQTSKQQGKNSVYYFEKGEVVRYEAFIN
ncbi:MAG: GGDEF domain-containing protein [Candidatus Micrarchaeota archaeon]